MKRAAAPFGEGFAKRRADDAKRDGTDHAAILRAEARAHMVGPDGTRINEAMRGQDKNGLVLT